MRKPIVNFATRMMYALDVPLSLVPFCFRSVHPHRSSYRPFFQAWRTDIAFQGWLRESDGEIQHSHEAQYYTAQLARSALLQSGEVWLCGIHRGGTARLLINIFLDQGYTRKKLRLFDGFSTLPERNDATDRSIGSAAMERLRALLGNHSFLDYHRETIAETFEELNNSRICFAHLDLTDNAAVESCMEFIYPRLEKGGIVLIEGYGRPSTTGVRAAIDTYFGSAEPGLVVLNTGQAFVTKP